MPPASRGHLVLLLHQKCRPTVFRGRQLANIVQRSPNVESAINPPAGIRLREYQEECIQSVLSYLEKGHKRLGISLATGSGKTVIFTQLIHRIKSQSKDADQTLILAHRQELVEQAARHCLNAYPSKTVEVEMGNVHASGGADITIASIQSLLSGDRIAKFDPGRFKLVLVDEAHHIVAPGYMKALEYFGLSTERLQPNAPALVGVSATLSRFDGLRLGAAIDHIVYHKDYIDMIGEKWLSDVLFTTVESKADISKVRTGATGDFQASELSRAVNTSQINEITVRSWLAKAEGRKSTLVFCIDLAHVFGLTNTFRVHGVDARFVTGNTPKAERSAILDSFRAGEFPVLVNCSVFTEGTDVPNIDCIILARPTRSRNLLAQMIGRGMRLHRGKANCHIIDMVASLATGIVTTPTLFGLDPSEMINNANLDDLKAIRDRKEAERAQQKGMQSVAAETSSSLTEVPRRVTFTDYDTVFDLIKDTSRDQHIRAISNNAWVEVDRDRYILSTPHGSFLNLEKTFNETKNTIEYVVKETKLITSTPTTKAPYRAPREIARLEKFEAAIHAADTYTKGKYNHIFISKRAPWRHRPATEGQLNFLNKLRPKDDPLTANNITKGKAVDMITKIRHGARGRFTDMETQKRREDRARLKTEQVQALREREQVRVGPLEEV